MFMSALVAADSGATLPVVGMKCWKHWLRLPWIRAHEAEVKYDRCDKLFRFGGGKTLPSTVCVSFHVKVFKHGSAASRCI